MGKRNLGDQSTGQRRSRLTGAARFAATISARYLRGVGDNLRVPRVLRRALAWTWLAQHHWSALLSPRIQFAVTRTHRASTAAASNRTVLSRETHQRVVERFHSRTRLVPAVRHAAIQSQEHSALSRAPATRLQTSAPTERVTRSERLPRVLQQAPRPAQAFAEPQRAPPRRMEAEPMVPLPPAELERVTTHVVRAIDRRLSAWRERTGRV